MKTANTTLLRRHRTSRRNLTDTATPTPAITPARSSTTPPSESTPELKSAIPSPSVKATSSSFQQTLTMTFRHPILRPSSFLFHFIFHLFHQDLIFTRKNPTVQHWYKDFRWGNEVKDEEGLPAFALINKATGLAIKHSIGPKHPVGSL